MAKMMIANNNNKAMLTKGPMALPMADITTCKPEREETNHILSYRLERFTNLNIGFEIVKKSIIRWKICI